MKTVTTKKDPTKYITVTYLSDGQVEVESNDMTVFDLWALSSYVKMRADEMYMNVLQQQRTREQAKSQLSVATQMPRSAMDKPRSS